MPGEVVTVQVGQAGNQIGRRFWELALQEASLQQESCVNLEGSGNNSFFHNARNIEHMRARAILVDMEEGPIAETIRSPLGRLFQRSQIVTGVSGAGNNFAHGYLSGGDEHGLRIMEAARKLAEQCDSLQAFAIIHSLSGGTGSGLGSRTLSLLEDHFPGVCRIANSVFPSKCDDVVTSPYNSVLATSELESHADAVLPVENQALSDILHKGWAEKYAATGPSAHSAKPYDEAGSSGSQRSGFTDINSLIAKMLIDLTASSRFPGPINMDLNEITTNLVPYPRMQFLIPSRRCCNHLLRDRRTHSRQHWKDLGQSAFAPGNQLMEANLGSHPLLACALLYRGSDVSLADVSASVSRAQAEVTMAPWNREGIKVGLCSVPGLESGVVQPSLQSLCNSCSIASTFARMDSNFNKLWSRKAMVHHYAEYMEVSCLGEAREAVLRLSESYESLATPTALPRIPVPLF